MSTDRDTARIVRSWLEEGVTALPDRVLDAVLDQVPTTPQRRSWWPPRRFPQMKNFARLAVVGAAVVAVAIVGYSLLPRNSSVSGPPSPTPSPKPTPIALAYPQLHTPVAGGSYAFHVGSPGDGAYFPVQITMPAGWILQKLDVDAVSFSRPDPGVSLEFYTVARVYRDPCHPETGYAGTYRGTSNTTDLVYELRTFAEFHAGGTSALPIGRLQATHFVISNTIDTQTAGCTDGALLPLFITSTANRATELTTRSEQSPATKGGTEQEIWIVDRGDLYPLLIVGEVGRTPAADRATLDAIVASIVIE